MSSKHRFGEFQSWVESNGGRITSGVRGDHVCRPVIVGADGRARSVILSSPDHHHHLNNDSGENKIKEIVDTAGRKMGLNGGLFRNRNQINENTSVTRKLDESEPAMINSDGFEHPTRTGWAMPASVPLGTATNDAGIAVNYLRGNRSYASVGRKASAIDSREAANKYGGRFVW